MHVPPAFAENRLPVLFDAIRRAGLATLVTMGTEGLEATPLPLLLDEAEGERGTLYGHLSRGNPQWRRFDSRVEALVMVQGPDAYVTPSWYPTKAGTGKVVPTWNYVAVHAYGPLEVFEDAGRLHGVVARLSDRHEAGRADPWGVDDAPADFIAAQLKGIVGIRIPIARIEGKWKASQNRTPADRAGVAAGLAAEGQGAMAALVPTDP
ncbi:transcriptional regulator [Azospirillum fermentarium]|uniref:FMN-binding negative transcriptional regulator n=1 Tax=Azospirillum fermentarium TaxID=1233114 RepID=UPI0022276791|nr:FMN-binding negative transcriptional regulator [Azospirillum fermentarium]MCW2248381.1 transcriptional regulator [Azospirillum fermentarium]